MEERLTKDDIGGLLEYCSKHLEVYNDIANHLYYRFGLKGAELTLLITYYVVEERRKKQNG